TGGFGDARALGHPARLAAGELHDMRPDAGSLAAQSRDRSAVDQVVARGHFRHHEPGPQRRCKAPKRRVGNPRHRRKKDRMGDFNIAYFQRLATMIKRAGHERLVSLGVAAVRSPNGILSTKLVQSSIMPTL